MRNRLLLLLPACGEKVGMRGAFHRFGLVESPLTPTLSPQERIGVKKFLEVGIDL